MRLEAVMGHLAPGDAAMRQAAKDAVSTLEKEIRGIGVISLSATAAVPVRAPCSPAPRTLPPRQWRSPLLVVLCVGDAWHSYKDAKRRERI